MREHFGGRIVKYYLALVHYNDSFCLSSLVHIMGYEYDGYTVFTVEPANGLHDLSSARRVKHCCRLVPNDAVGAHCDYSRNGDTLLLTAGKL